MNLPTHQLTMTVLMSPDMANFSGNVHGGAILKLLDQVAYACAGKSSMEVGIKVIAENIRTQEVRHVNSCFFTMVAVDDHGKAAPVPALQPETDDEKRRFEAAQMRKALRHELEEKFRKTTRQPGAA
jgi:acyl-CoA hydrolase